MMNKLVSSAALILMLALSAAAEDLKKGVTDPADAGPDFAIQGEYTGTIASSKIGMQVIARGDGKFEIVGFPGGLPGDGWDLGQKARDNGELKDGTLVFSDGRKATIKDNVFQLLDPNGKEAGKLEKVIRKSPTLGAKPPEGAVVLFDGSTADNFKDGRMTPDKLLMQGATSKQLFRNFKIHLEFMIPFMPYAKGQGRGNSGFYAQGRYEVQILDSFGLDAKDNECGGIYSVGQPKLIMSYPPLSWQTYDIEFTAPEWKDGKKVKNARMTVVQNGVTIHDDIEIDHATTASIMGEGPTDGPIYLQNHGNPVRFRNVWLIEKK